MIVMITIALEIYVIAKARRLWKGVPHLKPWNVFKLGLYIRIVAFTFLQLFLFVYDGLSRGDDGLLTLRMTRLFATEFVWNTVPAHIIPIVYEALSMLASPPPHPFVDCHPVPLITFFIFSTASVSHLFIAVSGSHVCFRTRALRGNGGVHGTRLGGNLRLKRLSCNRCVTQKV